MKGEQEMKEAEGEQGIVSLRTGDPEGGDSWTLDLYLQPKTTFGEG